MAYPNIATPRIYINIPQFLESRGAIINPLLRTLPVGNNTISTTAMAGFPDMSAITLTNPYIALLGHNLQSHELIISNASFGTEIVNFTNGTFKTGFSILNYTEGTGDTALSCTETGYIMGSVVVGTFFEFPHSPDLNLSLSYSYDGHKEITTKGGSTLTNSYYHGVPKWGNDLGAWELGGTAAYAKSGRREWSLNFSYLSDSSIFPLNAGLVNNDDTTTNTLLEDDSFQRCIHLLNGGQNSFLFQPDSTVNDNFAIAKFDMKSFKFSQVSINTYNCKIRIKEVW